MQYRIVMPADNTYYVGGRFASGTDPVTSVSVTGAIRASVPYCYVLPTVSRVRVVKGRADPVLATRQVGGRHRR